MLHYSEYNTSALLLISLSEEPRDAARNVDDRIKRERDGGEQEEWRERQNEEGKGQRGRMSHVSLVLTFLSVSPGNEYPDKNVPNWWWSETGGGGGGLFDVH